MSNIFTRFPAQGGDDNAWGPYEEAQNYNTIGMYSARLYDDSGTLKMSAGRIGIDNGTLKGTCELDTVTTISISGVTSGAWAVVEAAVSGTAVTISVTDISGETDGDSVPALLAESGYDYEKIGYYATATKRVLGVIWKDSSGALGGVINVNSMSYGYHGKVYIDTSQICFYEVSKKEGYYDKTYICTATLDLTAGTAKSISWSTAIDLSKIVDMSVVFLDDAGTSIYKALGYGDVDAGTSVYLYIGAVTSTAISIGYDYTNSYFNGESASVFTAKLKAKE